jgi:hypothetical protein
MYDDDQIRKSDLVDLELTILGATDLAIKVLNLKESYIWLPKSLIEYDKDSTEYTLTITMPHWLAEEKELL